MGSRHRAPERQINRMETQHHFRYWQPRGRKLQIRLLRGVVENESITLTLRGLSKPAECALAS